MKAHWRKLLVVIVALLLALAWWGWQAGGMQLLQPGLAWC